MLLIHLIYQNIHENLARKIDTMDFGFDASASASAISEYINKLDEKQNSKNY
jgi:hypothetical protein